MYDEAIDTYRQLIQAHPGDPLAARAQYGIGDAYFNSGRLADAVAAYRVVLERYPQSPYVADAAAGMQYALSAEGEDRKSTRLNSSHVAISYAVFCLKKKTKQKSHQKTNRNTSDTST